MPNRYLQAMKHKNSKLFKSQNLKGVFRLPEWRNRMRQNMFERLAAEVREREVKALMDQMEIGKSKPKRVRKPKVSV